MILHYQSHFIAKELFPEDTHTSRINSISRKDCISFVNHPDVIALISSIGDINAKPPSNTGLEHNSKVTCSPADSFHKHIKRDAGIFTAFKKKIGAHGA